MRSTLACPWCRRSKIKCVHDGRAPCRSCKGSTRQETCVLSTPETKWRAPRRSVARRSPRRENNAAPSTPIPEQLESSANPEEALILDPVLLNQPSIVVAPATPSCEEALIPLAPLPLLIAAGRHLIHHFPGVSFIHPPTFFQSLRDGNFDRLKVCAILAVSSRFIPELITKHGSGRAAGQFYADIVRARLHERMRQGPHIETIQCCILMGMYEWGYYSGFLGWMYVGMAIRMAQVLKLDPNLDTTSSPGSPEQAVIQQEIRDRTIWSCFIMDRSLSCGKDRPTVFVLSEMRIPLPLSEVDFAFGEIREERKHVASMNPELGACWTMEHHFAIIVQGFDLWATLGRWTADGGRRKYHSPGDCPWEPTSAWGAMSRDLETWRSHQDERVRYSPARLATQLEQRHAEAFAFINLLYYLCLIFLHRDFIPLLPLRTGGPTGPIDPPFQSEAPAGWWESSAETLYQAADSVADILHGLIEAKMLVMTPLAGFSAFLAALTHSQVAAFPHLNLGRSVNPATRADISISYLREFAEVWKIGEGWLATLNDTRQLFERALSNKLRYVGRSISLKGKRLEYGSITSMDVSPEGATSSLEEANARESSPPGPGPGPPRTSPPPTSGISQGYDALSNFLTEFPQDIGLNEELWGMNDMQLSQHHLYSFAMGNEPGMFG